LVNTFATEASFCHVLAGISIHTRATSRSLCRNYYASWCACLRF